MWNIKAFTIAFIPLTVILCAEFYRQFYIKNEGFMPTLFKADFFLWGYISLVSFSFFSYGGIGSVEIYVKILTVLVAFYLGKVTPLFNIKRIYLFYTPIYLIIILSLITGNGFQYWGNILTFSGGYFYKTDLAIGLTLFTVFMLVSDLNVKVKLSFVLLNLLLIFLANSRMYLLLLPIVTALYFYRRIIFLNTKRFFVMLPIFFSLIFLVFYSINDILLNFGLLAVDFNDFFSGKNLQGRDLLWDNLLSSYYDFSSFNQLFGFGLVKDTELAFLTGYFESTNAHNTYIFNLISVGLFGSLFFFSFIITSFKRLLSLFEKYSDYPKLYDLLYLSVAFTFLFFIAGFSATVISFLQLSWFYFFFMGVLYSVNFQKFNK
jgi:hypothetical protein